MLTEGMTTEQIIELAKTRPEFVWHWGTRIQSSQEIQDMAKELGLELFWGEPIRPGDMYLGKRNTLQLLTCRELGEACVHPKEIAYPFDFNECVKVKEAA